MLLIGKSMEITYKWSFPVAMSAITRGYLKNLQNGIFRSGYPFAKHGRLDLRSSANGDLVAVEIKNQLGWVISCRSHGK